MNFIYQIFCSIFKRKKTLIKKVYKELEITQDEFAQVLGVSNLVIQEWNNGNFSDLIESLLNQLILCCKETEKKEACLKAIKKIIIIDSFKL
jgi:DNA-binding XRE family transcriptional regulator